MEDPSEIARCVDAGELLYVHALELIRPYVTHVRRVTVGTHRWCILTLAGLCSELLVTKDAFTLLLTGNDIILKSTIIFFFSK